MNESFDAGRHDGPAEAFGAEDAARVEEIIRAAGEPLPIGIIARRFFAEDEAREAVQYTPGHAYQIGQRVVWDTMSFGRLIGDVARVESVRDHWQMLVDWDPRLSPGLAKYRASREGSRVAYRFDPSATPAESPQAEAGVSVAQLLDLDLADHLREHSWFAEWARAFAHLSLLPQIDAARLDRAAVEATLDDGVAQTNQMLDLLGLPSPDQLGHGFAAMAVNLAMDARPAWAWSGPRDGGEWLPTEQLAAAAAAIGPARTIRSVFPDDAIPEVSDEELPEDLADLVVDATLRGIATNEQGARLHHILSDWERSSGCLLLDEAELAQLPRQATIRLVPAEGTPTPALVLAGGIVQSSDPSVVALLRGSSIVRLERLGATDEFRLTPLAPAPETATVPNNLLGIVIDAFPDREPVTSLRVLAYVRSRIAGDLAVLARIVAGALAGYACFVPEGGGWTYDPELPHSPRAGVGMSRLRTVERRSTRARADALRQDREFRRFRAESMRSRHMVRGHLRRLTKSEAANPFQVALARRHGIAVPLGFTFVRPHERHGGGWVAWRR